MTSTVRRWQEPEYMRVPTQLRVVQRAAPTNESAPVHTELSGLAVPYNTPTNLGWSGYEVVLPHAFDKSIREAAMRLPFLLFHNSQSWPIGAATVSPGWESKDDGLYCTWELDDSEEAQRAASLADKGMLSGLSIGFQPVPGKEWMADPATLRAFNLPDDALCFVVEEGRLVETSLCSTPAYADAVVTSVRSSIAPHIATQMDGRPEGLDERIQRASGRQQPRSLAIALEKRAHRPFPAAAPVGSNTPIVTSNLARAKAIHASLQRKIQ